MRKNTILTALSAATMSVYVTGATWAQDGLGKLEVIGKPVNGKMGFQPAVTELARDIDWLDGMINIIIGFIVLFVVALLLIVVVRYNSRSNPVAATFTHNTPIEVTWTIVPIVILVFIGAFSLPILFKQQEFPVGDINIKVTGNQWYWNYQYVDDGFGFDSYLIDASYKINDPANGWGPEQPMGGPQVMNEITAKKLAYFGYEPDEFLLAADNAVVVPINKIVVMHVTGSDVIHAWAMPAFGVMQSAVPGRLAQLWFKAEKEGVYFGQCTSLCGKDHAYMPIVVKVVSQEAYDAWLGRAKQQFAGVPSALPADVTVASNN